MSRDRGGLLAVSTCRTGCGYKAVRLMMQSSVEKRTRCRDLEESTSLPWSGSRVCLSCTA